MRSGFDLLLQALPADGEILVSAVTHPDMVRIIERHGLHAVPVDLDLATLAPRTELFERAVSPRTRANLVAHLFGGRVDLGPLAEFAREPHLLLFEGCAQAFRGPHYTGDPLTGVSMFSFGPLKTATALGGAVVVTRKHTILTNMRDRQSSWPVLRRRAYLGKILKFLFLVQVTRPTAHRLLYRACKLLGKDFDALVNTALRSGLTGLSSLQGGLRRGLGNEQHRCRGGTAESPRLHTDSGHPDDVAHRLFAGVSRDCGRSHGAYDPGRQRVRGRPRWWAEGLQPLELVFCGSRSWRDE